MKASRSGLIGRMALVAAAIATLITAGTQQAAGDITDNLIGHWKLDENTGLTTADSSGSGKTGTLVNNPLWWVDGKINSALDFNGVSGDTSGSRVELASNGLNMGSGSFTMAAWINPDTITGTAPRGIIGTKTVGGAGFCVVNSRLYLGGKNNNAELYSLPLPIAIGSWQHVAVVMNRTAPSSVTFYLNGVEYVNVSTYQPTDLVFIEKTDRIGSYGDGEMFDGKIDDARIYNRALSASDVTELYNYPPAEITGSVLIVR